MAKITKEEPDPIVLWDHDSVGPKELELPDGATPAYKLAWIERMKTHVRSMEGAERAVLIKLDDDQGVFYLSSIPSTL